MLPDKHSRINIQIERRDIVQMETSFSTFATLFLLYYTMLVFLQFQCLRSTLYLCLPSNSDITPRPKFRPFFFSK